MMGYDIGSLVHRLLKELESQEGPFPRNTFMMPENDVETITSCTGIMKVLQRRSGYGVQI